MPSLLYGRRSCQAPVGVGRFVIRATHERGVGALSSRSLSAASREARSILQRTTTTFSAVRLSPEEYAGGVAAEALHCATTSLDARGVRRHQGDTALQPISTCTFVEKPSSDGTPAKPPSRG